MWKDRRKREDLSDEDQRFVAFGLRYLLLVSGLVVLTLAVAIGIGSRGDRGARTAPDDRTRLAMMRAGFSAADQLLLAASHLATERGLVYEALYAGRPITSEQRGEITNLRNSSNRALDAAFGIMRSELGMSQWGHLFAEADEARLDFDALRQTIDTSKAMLPDEQNHRLAIKWFWQASRLLARAENVLDLLHVEIQNASSDGRYDPLLQMQQIALTMSIAAGRERGLLSAAIAASAPLPVALPRWDVDVHRRMDARWQDAKSLASAGLLTPEIMTLIDQIDRLYFSEVRSVRKGLEHDSNSRRPYRVTAAIWFAQTTHAIDHMLELGRTAGRLARERQTRLHSS